MFNFKKILRDSIDQKRKIICENTSGVEKAIEDEKWKKSLLIKTADVIPDSLDLSENGNFGNVDIKIIFDLYGKVLDNYLQINNFHFHEITPNQASKLLYNTNLINEKPFDRAINKALRNFEKSNGEIIIKKRFFETELKKIETVEKDGTGLLFNIIVNEGFEIE